MTSDPDAGRESFELAGDGALFTAASLAVLTSIVLLVTEVGAAGQEPSMAVQFASALVVFLGTVAGPVAAWLMHRRRISLPAVLGAFLGVPAAGAVFALFVGFSAALGWAISPLSDAEWAGPLVGAIVVTAGFFALVAWLVVDAARDRSADPPEHHSLDVARIVSAIVATTYTAVIAVVALSGTSGEIVEAIGFMLVGAVIGALVVFGADLATRLAGRKTGASAGTDS